MARLIKVSKLSESIQEVLGLNPATLKLALLLFEVTFIAHLAACLWFGVSQGYDNPSDSWLQVAEQH